MSSVFPATKIVRPSRVAPSRVAPSRVAPSRVLMLLAAMLSVLTLVGCAAHQRFGHDPKISYPLDHAHPPSLAIGSRGGSLTYVALGDPKTLNAWITDDTNSSAILSDLYDSLEARDPFTLKFMPRLANLPKISADGLTYTYTLRPNLKWSDGVPLTADDVIFTLNLLYDPTTQGLYREVLLIDVDQPGGTVKRVPFQYAKIDERTVKFVLPTKWAPAEGMFTFAIAPKHVLEGPYKAGKFNTTWGVDTPPMQLIASGPYTIAQYVPGQRIVYEPNPYFWRRDANGGAMPYVKTLRYVITPDTNAMALDFRSGGCDVLNVPLPQYPPIARYADRDNYTVVDRGPEFSFTYLGFNENLHAKLSGDLLSLFRNKTFRQAMSYAVDRQRICDTVYIGLAKPLYTPVTPANTQYFDPNAKTYPYDPAKAIALLMQIHGVARSAGGALTYHGKPIAFTITTIVENPALKAIATILQGELRDLGLDVTITAVTFNDLVRRLDAPPFDWEAVVLGYGGGPEPNDASGIWRSSGSVNPWWPRQKTPSTAWEARIDRDFTDGAHALSLRQRKKSYDDWQETLGEEQPVLFLDSQEAYTAIRNHYGNIRPSANGGIGNDEEIFDMRAGRSAQ